VEQQLGFLSELQQLSLQQLSQDRGLGLGASAASSGSGGATTWNSLLQSLQGRPAGAALAPATSAAVEELPTALSLQLSQVGACAAFPASLCRSRP
jgi:hypothetical protein